VKIAVIGDSHVAALKRAWPSVAEDFTDVSITFFAVGAGEMRNVRLKGDSLVPENDFVREHFALTSEGLEEIRIGDYDNFVLVGMQPTNFQAADSLWQHRTIDYSARDGAHLVSRACFREAIKQRIKSSPSGRLSEMIAQRKEAPIFLIRQSLPDGRHLEQNSAQLRAESKNYVHIVEIAQKGEWAQLLADYSAAYREVFDSSRVTVIQQPPETVHDGLFTHPVYCSVDFRHTLPQFGNLQLRYFLNRIDR